MITLWHRFWYFIRINFLTKKFLMFGIIGIANTGIHMLIYWIIYDLFNLGALEQGWGAFLSNTAAFLLASLFSYFANVIFTFKPITTSAKQFAIVLTVFLMRMLISNLLASGFDILILNWFHADYDLYPWMTIIAPFVASVLLFPLAYFVLKYVFQKNDQKKIESK